jgi:hypothetical protein
MSDVIVYAYVIYNGTTSTFVGDDYVTVAINCGRLQAYSPRPAWLVRELAPGDGTIILYIPTFYPSSEQLLDPNTLPGLWVEVDGQDVMIDVQNQNPTTFITACNACCGSVPTIVASNYNGNVPDFSPLPLNSLCIYRFDDGSAGAHDAMAASYVGLYVGTMQLRSNFSNTSHYTFQSFYTYTQFLGKLIGTDTLYQGACGS